MIFWDKLRSFSTLYEKLAEPVREQYELTQLEFDILMFLHNNPQYRTANDMVKVRHLTKSNVSAAVSSLESKGLLERSYMEGNRKSIQLRLKPEAEEIIDAGKKVQSAYGNTLIQGFSEAEKEQFVNMFLRMCANADAELERRIK